MSVELNANYKFYYLLDDVARLQVTHSLCIPKLISLPLADNYNIILGKAYISRLHYLTNIQLSSITQSFIETNFKIGMVGKKAIDIVTDKLYLLARSSIYL